MAKRPSSEQTSNNGTVSREEFEALKRVVETLDHHAGHPKHPDDKDQDKVKG